MRQFMTVLKPKISKRMEICYNQKLEFGQMGFSNPESFLALLLLIPFIGLILYNHRKKRTILNSFLSRKAYGQLGIRSGREIDFFKASLVVIAFVFFITALAGPEWGEVFERVEVKGIEMLFLLDTSNSMNAEDLKPNRLEFAKQLMYTIVKNFNTDYCGLINFAATAYVQCPLTVDYEAFNLLTEASVISPDEEQGTDFSSALGLALKSFKTSGKGKKIIVLITDGEDQEGKWAEMIPELEKQNIIAFTIGIGDRSGAPIPLKNNQGEITGWKKDRQGNMVRTRLDEKTLIQLASRTNGQYFRFTDISAIGIFIDNLKSFERSVISKRMKSSRKKRFYFPLLLGIICLLFEMFLTEKKLKWKER